MKALKVIIFSLLGIVAIFLISALFINGEYKVEKSIEIDRSNAEVFEYIKYLKNQGDYSVWQKMDPDMDHSYIGVDGTVGFVSGWDSDNDQVGRGEQEIVKIKEGKRIDYELRFFEPFEAKDKAYMTTEAIGPNKTTVKWGFEGKMDYPMNFMMLFMDMEEMLGKDLEEGLVGLKKCLEV